MMTSHSETPGRFSLTIQRLRSEAQALLDAASRLEAIDGGHVRSRRGRKPNTMSATERLEVSARMKAFWKQRRQGA